ncbi:MAG: UDP-glucose 4-epimerase GalE [Ilumatobacteraceae bacterium]
MTVLVTGGAGYIGSHTVRALRRDGRDVVVLDSLELGHRAAVLDAPLVVGDIADHDLVTTVCRDYGVTGVVHFAAYKSVGESMHSPGKYWNNNVGKSAALFDSLAMCGVSAVVFSSSCSVYGTPDTVPVAEDAAIRPESVYAESKAIVERILAWYSRTNHLRSVSLRYFNAAGASDDALIGEDWTHSINLVPVVMKAALGRRGPVEVFGTDYPTADGTCVRDYIHVDDLAAAHLAALDYLSGGGATAAVNVGTGIGSSVLEVIRATERIAGVDVPHTLGPRRAGDPIATYARPDHAAQLLGWRATRSLDDIITSAWRWHSAHPDGYGLTAG